MILLLMLVFIAWTMWYVATRYATIGKNVGHPNPSMAYFFFIPLVLNIYILQMARFSSQKIGVFIGLMVISFSIPFFVGYQQLKSFQNKAQVSIEMSQMANDYTQKKVDMAVSAEPMADIPDYKESEEYKALEKKLNRKGLPPIVGILGNFFSIGLWIYFLVLVTKVVQVSWANIFWNLLPIAGPFLFIHFMVKASENVTLAEDDSVDVQAVFDSLAENEKQITLQIVEALKSPTRPTEAQIISQLANMGFDQDKSELITALALEIEKAQS